MDPKVLYPAIGIGSVVAIGMAYLFLKRETSSYPPTGPEYRFTTEALAPANSAPRGSVYESARGSESSMTGGKKSRRKKPSKKCSKRVWH